MNILRNVGPNWQLHGSTIHNSWCIYALKYGTKMRKKEQKCCWTKAGDQNWKLRYCWTTPGEMWDQNVLKMLDINVFKMWDQNVLKMLDITNVFKMWDQNVFKMWDQKWKTTSSHFVVLSVNFWSSNCGTQMPQTPSFHGQSPKLPQQGVCHTMLWPCYLH